MDNRLFDFDEPIRKRFTEPDLDKGEAAKRLYKAQKLSDLYRADSPQTSVDAAKKLLPKLGNLQKQIVDCLEANGPLMVWQICERIGREKPSVSARMRALVDAGLVEEAGVGISNNNSKATIYKRRT